MHTPPERERWEAYCAEERTRLEPLLAQLGFELDSEQPHLGGERYLMYAVTTASGSKLILLGARCADGMRVVIKATSDADGKRELAREHRCRGALRRIGFAYEALQAPRELCYTDTGGFRISVQQFLPQERPFLSRPLREQFSLLLAGLKAQESAHATTYRHRREIVRTFGHMDVDGYLVSYAHFARAIAAACTGDNGRTEMLERVDTLLHAHRENLERYGSFLTHTDFVPHNFRIVDGVLYLLDHASIRFGNKYEGWARLINFMTLYNPPLARALSDYVRLNRSPEEIEALWLMRLYRLVELIYYYTQTLPKSEGDLLTLNRVRVEFWSAVLRATLAQEWVTEAERTAYERTRDVLRGAGERARQVGLH